VTKKFVFTQFVIRISIGLCLKNKNKAVYQWKSNCYFCLWWNKCN